MEDVAECSTDEKGEELEDADDVLRDDEADTVKEHKSDTDESDESDEEVKELMKRKVNLEWTKRKLKDETEQKRLQRQRKKQLLRAEVETLENEVMELTTEVMADDYKQNHLK